MTERLYYDDASLAEFDATVVRVEPRGDRIAVWLDRTAFYPTSGGQPFDVGTLDGVVVRAVEEDELGDVMHLLEGHAPANGAMVHGAIDWVRRFDHMQQHTGQHLLSAVLEHTFQARTVSFHLGAESSTIDLDRELTPGQIARCELAANQVVWSDRSVSIRYATDEEARALPLRKESARSGVLRLVEIEHLDLSACGGTHVTRTGAIGQIVIASWERFKGGQRLEFLCGSRTLSRYQHLRDASAASIRLLSVLPADLPAAIDRLQGELKDARRALAAVQTDLASYEAAAMADVAENIGSCRLLLRAVDGDANRLKALASAVVTRPGLAVVLVSNSVPALAVVARSIDVAVAGHDIVKALTAQFGGRGGGKPDLAQCGGLQGTPDAILAAARALLM
jgi:alanyl-tRNA synthetase